MTVTVFVGDNDESLAEHATAFDESAFLINNKNYKLFLNTTYTSDVTVYTSNGDLIPLNDEHNLLFEVLDKADCIFYRPPKKWSDDVGRNDWRSNKRITEWFLYCINLKKTNVDGLDLTEYQTSNYLNLETTRNTESKVLWIIGCSFSLGVGVSESQRYGHILSTDLNLPARYLTKGGSSLKWQADQILRSDIRKDDIVVWGLTSEVRTVKINHGKVLEENDPDIRFAEIRSYDAITSVYQVVNFCRKVQCQLVLLPLLSTELLNLSLLHLNEYTHLGDYTYLPWNKKFLDLGTDKKHPGIQTHKMYAKYALDKISKLNLHKE